MMNSCRRALYTLLVCSAAAAAAPEEFSVHKPFQNEFLLQPGDVVASNLKTFSNGVELGKVYFTDLGIVMKWEYEDFRGRRSRGTIVNMRCTVKDYLFQNCSLLHRNEVVARLDSKTIQELNQHLDYNLVYTHNKTHGATSWDWSTLHVGSSLTPPFYWSGHYPPTSSYGSNYRWNKTSDQTGYFLKNPAEDNVVKLKMIGQWTLSSEFLSRLLAVLDRDMKNVRVPGFVYKSSVTATPDVCVDTHLEKEIPGGCAHTATVYTPHKQKTVTYEAYNQPTPYRFSLTFDPQSGGYVYKDSSPIPVFNDFDFSFHVTKKPIFE